MAVDVWFMRVAALYILAGMALGIAMGIGEDFTFQSVHAHINLAGWASMGLFALAYRAWPDLAATKLARWHFWISNIGVPLLVIGIFLQIQSNGQMPAVVITGSLLTILGALLFAIVVWSRLGR